MITELEINFSQCVKGDHVLINCNFQFVRKILQQISNTEYESKSNKDW